MKCRKCGHKSDDQAPYCASCGAPVGSTSGEAGSVQNTSTFSSTKGYAGFWKRFIAGFIDTILLGVATGMVSVFTYGVGVSLGIIAQWLYFSLMESSSYQATIGKLAMSIVVTDMDGRRITFWKATGRFFTKFLLSLLLLPYIVSCIAIAFTRKKQAFHDMIAGCLVLKK